MKNLSSLVVLFLLAGHLRAQTPPPPATPQPPDRIPVWRCELPGGTFTVALRSMVSVSMHEYIADVAVRVTEVNVDTVGNALARFYYQEPIVAQSPLGIGQSTINKVQELVTEAGRRTGQEELWKKVVKNYPTSTHAHTVDYRVESKDQLAKIFESAEGALRKGREATVRLSASE